MGASGAIKDRQCLVYRVHDPGPFLLQRERATEEELLVLLDLIERVLPFTSVAESRKQDTSARLFPVSSAFELPATDQNEAEYICKKPTRRSKWSNEDFSIKIRLKLQGRRHPLVCESSPISRDRAFKPHPGDAMRTMKILTFPRNYRCHQLGTRDKLLS